VGPIITELHGDGMTVLPQLLWYYRGRFKVKYRGSCGNGAIAALQYRWWRACL